MGVGDLLFIYTDGLIEARQAADLFGEDRLKEALEEALTEDISDVPEKILQVVDGFSGGTLHDDIAMLLVKREPVTQEVPLELPQAPSIAALITTTPR
jgi:serine phosphatase RsbU (regulator of sigma subunit)